MEIIAISGYARSGKDEAAKVLVGEFGYTRVAFADKLREVLYALNPIVSYERGYRDHPSTRRVEGELWMPIFVQDVISVHGWDGYKQTKYEPEIRRLMQHLGTEAGRGVLGENLWVDAALDQADDAKIVITDCRFPNEAKRVKESDGKIWRIRRNGIGPANNHISDTALDDWAFDILIDNNSTLAAYRQKIRSCMRYHQLSG